MGLLENKICVITGGAGDIGLTTAKLFHQEGGTVILVDQKAVVPDLISSWSDSNRVCSLTADVSDERQVKACMDEVETRYGNIDVLFSNAGTFGEVAPISSYPIDVFDRVYAVNVKGAFLMCKYAVPIMKDGGSIIINSSISGFRGDPGVVAYVTAKHAQIGLMRSLAKELASRNIRVNTLHPGPIDNQFQKDVEDKFSELLGQNATDFMDSQIPLGRHVQTSEIAQSVLYLASSMSSFTTGSTLCVDGGLRL